MDFFAQQEHARRSSRRLMILFALSVIALIIALNVVASWAIVLDPQLSADGAALHAVVTVLAIGAIAIGSAIKTAELRAGGSVIAEMMGAKPVQGGTATPAERMLLNIVEEMSIASGVPMPLVYVMDDPGINAFAAGHRPSDAVVAVTRGCIERLTRSELQGVVGHEFSHLLNGDMRLNLRLVGLVGGILILAETGRFLVRVFGQSNGSSRKDSGGGAIALVGAALFVLGYLGYFFSRLIKAAIGRQREYLADASSVQFTREPAAIGGALKKLGTSYARSLLAHPRSDEFSHMFFGNAIRNSWIGLFATHPPIEARIRAVDPRWNGEWPMVAPISESDRQPPSPTSPGAASLAADQIASRVGRVSPEHLAFGAALLSNLPGAVTAATREPFSARAAVLALLIDARPEIAERQWLLVSRRDAALAADTRRLLPLLAPLGDAVRLPVLNLAIPSLRLMSAQQKEEFLAAANELIAADEQVSLSEGILARLLAVHLSVRLPTAAAIYSMHPLLPAVSVVVSALAHYGSPDEARARDAFAVGIGKLGLEDGRLMYVPESGLTDGDIARALDAIAPASAGLKRRILNACAWCVAADGTVAIREAELMRLIADSLGCPLPPFHDLQGQTASALSA